MSHDPAPHVHENHFLCSADESLCAGHALLVLNSDSVEGDVLRRLWNQCGTHVCCDGGANRLHGVFGRDEKEKDDFIPNAIVGDLDSVRDDVKDFYK
jgi:thiamine pyrophosphokinase